MRDSRILTTTTSISRVTNDFEGKGENVKPIQTAMPDRLTILPSQRTTDKAKKN